jgi:hypothetical protein
LTCGFATVRRWERARREAIMTSKSADGKAPVPGQCPRVSIEELAHGKGVRPVESLDEMARDVFASDDELEEFLAFVHADR